jgi:hypothetical protein
MGAQMTVAEAVRSLLGLAGANSAEADPNTPAPVARIPEDRVCYNDSRGAARMGGSDVKLSEGRIRSLYGDAAVVHERHCNRYEIDQQYVGGLALKGLRMVGVGMDSGLSRSVRDRGPSFLRGGGVPPGVFVPSGQTAPALCGPDRRSQGAFGPVGSAPGDPFPALRQRLPERGFYIYGALFPTPDEPRPFPRRRDCVIILKWYASHPRRRGDVPNAAKRAGQAQADQELRAPQAQKPRRDGAAVAASVPQRCWRPCISSFPRMPVSTSALPFTTAS